MNGDDGDDDDYDDNGSRRFTKVMTLNQYYITKIASQTIHKLTST